MFVNILSWVVIGILAGLLVHLLFPLDNRYLVGTISSGIVGAFVGGILYSAFRIGELAFSFDAISLGAAILGAGLLIYFIRLLIRSEEEINLKNHNHNLKV